jgi:hypothetical protein
LDADIFYALPLAMLLDLKFGLCPELNDFALSVWYSTAAADGLKVFLPLIPILYLLSISLRFLRRS